LLAIEKSERTLGTRAAVLIARVRLAFARASRIVRVTMGEDIVVVVGGKAGNGGIRREGGGW
jgi:hypothetical protein